MNEIHSTAIIEKTVTISGEGNYIGPYCVISGNTIIGSNNRFESHCSIGSNPEHKDFYSKDGFLLIGNNNIFKEFITVGSSINESTKIGDNNFILRGSYIAHDSILEDNITLSANVTLGGFCYLMTGCVLGMQVCCHQFSIIGAYSMIGMSSVVTKKSKILVGNTYAGIPARFLKENSIGLLRNNVDFSKLNELKNRYELLIQRKC